MKRFLFYLFLILFICLSCNTKTFANDIKFVQVTDSHFTTESEYSANVLKATVKSINNLKGISFVVFTGDNIGKPRQENLINFVNIVNKLDVPYYLAFGNHDVFKSGGLSKTDYIKTIKLHNWLYRPSKPNYVIKKNGFVFLVVDGAKEVIPGNNGYYRETTLTWLDKQLTKHKKNPVIIVQHFPLVEPKQSKTHKTYNPDRYFDILAKHKNVISIISGHYHLNAETMKDGIYHISTPSLLSPPNNYKIIDIVTTKGFSPMIYTELRPVNVN